MGATANLSWRPAPAGDAEWMSGKSRTRLAPALTADPSWMSVRRAQDHADCGVDSNASERALRPVAADSFPPACTVRVVNRCASGLLTSFLLSVDQRSSRRGWWPQ